MPAPDCYSCTHADDTEPRQDVLRTDHWRVAHAFNSTLRGWLVVLPHEHVAAFTDLTPEAADELGPLVRRLSGALEEVTGCTKTYLMQFSEAEGFSHLHLHLVPRMPDQPEHLKGPRVFGYLTEDKAQWLPDETLDEVALAVRAAYDAG
jgi:diadenosine tetraphosphate (Ap4A) HIT family hydrolase